MGKGLATIVIALIAIYYLPITSFAAAPTLQDISLIVPGQVFKLFQYLEGFDFSFGFSDRPKTIPEIVESVPDTGEEARGFLVSAWRSAWGLTKGIGSFVYSLFGNFANWLHRILELPESYAPWRGG